MELDEVVRRRRMVRTYLPDPVEPGAVDRILRNAVRAPSAGFTQGWAFLVLDTPDDVRRFWRSTTPEGVTRPDSWLTAMRSAPVVVVPLSCRAAYVRRYGEADKGRDGAQEKRWLVPYWHLDAAMASLLMLLTAVDEGLGACFFGIPPEQVGAFRQEFGVPEDHTPIGAVTIGHPAPVERVPGSAARRGRRPMEEVVHRGHWSQASTAGDRG